jgi:hypothetical protein
VDRSQPSGLICSGNPSEIDCYMRGHGLATQFLLWAWKGGCEIPKKGSKIRDASFEFIQRAQSSQGGWYRTSKAEGHDLDDVLSTVIQLQALQTIHPQLRKASHKTMIHGGQNYLK